VLPKERDEVRLELAKEGIVEPLVYSRLDIAFLVANGKVPGHILRRIVAQAELDPAVSHCRGSTRLLAAGSR